MRTFQQYLHEGMWDLDDEDEDYGRTTLTGLERMFMDALHDDSLLPKLKAQAERIVKEALPDPLVIVDANHVRQKVRPQLVTAHVKTSLMLRTVTMVKTDEFDMGAMRVVFECTEYAWGPRFVVGVMRDPKSRFAKVAPGPKTQASIAWAAQVTTGNLKRVLSDEWKGPW